MTTTKQESSDGEEEASIEETTHFNPSFTTSSLSWFPLILLKLVSSHPSEASFLSSFSSWFFSFLPQFTFLFLHFFPTQFIKDLVIKKSCQEEGKRRLSEANVSMNVSIERS